MKRFIFGVAAVISAVCILGSSRPLYADGKVYQLSLEEVTRLALENNFDIQLARYDAWIARTGGMRAESIYDTVFDAVIEYQDDQSKKATTIFGTKTIENNYNVALSKKFSTGTTVDIDMTNNRSWTNSAFVTNPLTHDSRLGFTVEQELGKNFFGIQDRGNIHI